MAKTNYNYEKRARELEKQRKKEEKRNKKQALKDAKSDESLPDSTQITDPEEK